jgi:hypothetical protein
LDGAGYALLTGFPKTFALVKGRSPEYASVAIEQGGNAVVSWNDAEKQFLYYTLLDSAGATVTPPMIFISDPSPNPLVQSSLSGQGNASYIGVWQVFLPLVQKH